MKNSPIKSNQQKAQDAGFITLFMGLGLMLYSIFKINHISWFSNDYEAIRENYVVVFTFSLFVMLFSFITIFINRTK